MQLTQVANIRVQRQSAVLYVSLFRYPSAKMDIDYLGVHEYLLGYVIDTLIKVYECLLSCSRFVLNHNVQNMTNFSVSLYYV